MSQTPHINSPLSQHTWNVELSRWEPVEQSNINDEGVQNFNEILAGFGGNDPGSTYPAIKWRGNNLLDTQTSRVLPSVLP
jgi:hypothetical protein